MSDHALKGILLAGGSGTRLYPLTHVVSKQLMAVYDKPLIYYPLSTLMLAGLRDILVISTPEALPSFQRLLGDGEWLGLNLSYAAQPRPEGIAQAFVIGREFIGSSRSCLVLGDNIFYGHGLPAALAAARERREGATVFGYRVRNPSRYGVIAFEGDHRPVAIDEKPAHPRSRYAVTGLYFYDDRVLDYAAELRPSARGELEITDINRRYLAAGELNVEILGRGMVWLDTGTHESLLQAANFIEAIEQRQGLKIGCVEEIAWRLGLITAEQLAQLGHSLAASAYGQYLLDILDEAGPPR